MLMIALGAVLLLGTLMLLNLFAHARPAAVKASLVWGAGTIGAVGLVVLLFTGRGANALWMLVMFGPALRQAWMGWRARRRFARPAEVGEASGVETELLEMRLDLDSGAMSGRVRGGRFAGRELAALSLPELVALLGEAQALDAESVPLLEAWLDRAHPDWREAAAPPASPGAALSRNEALEVLGLEEGADEAAIRAAHRRLMQAAHPDRGGSDWLAARINQARDVLLG
jgi:hypothetical protein